MHAMMRFQLCAGCGRAYLDGVSRPPYPAKSCPICGKPAVERFRPFCSGRCKDVDLNRWLKGVYVIPVKDDEDEDGAPSVTPSDDPP